MNGLLLVSRLLGIEPQRLTRILSIVIPIIGGMLSQSLIKLVDAGMVGRLRETVLDGVGVGCYPTIISVSLVMGLSAGVQALVGRRHGASDTSLHDTLTAGL